MANIKSSAKRVLVSRVRAERNKADKSELKSALAQLPASHTICATNTPSRCSAP